MTDNYAAETPTAPLPTRTLLIGEDSGKVIRRFDEYMSASPGDMIELGPPSHDPGTDAVVIATRVTDAGGGEPQLELMVRVRRPRGDISQS